MPIPVLALLAGGLGTAASAYAAFHPKAKAASAPGTIPGLTPAVGPSALPGGGTPGVNLPTIPGLSGVPTTNDQAAWRAAIHSSCVSLAQNGKDPAAMEQVAAQVERYGFVDEATMLRARAAQIRASQVVPPSPGPPNVPPPAPVGGQAGVTTRDATLYTQPSKSASELGEVGAGTAVTVTRTLGATAGASAGWYELANPGGAPGYIDASDVQLEGGGGGSVTPTGGPTYGIVKASPGLNVHKQPSETSGLVANNDAWLGKRIEILQQNAGPPTAAAPQGWHQVRTPGGSVGFGAAQFIQIEGGGLAVPDLGNLLSNVLPQPTPSAVQSATTTAPSGMYVRSVPDERGGDATIISRELKAPGTRVTVLQTGFPATPAAPKGWTRITTPGGVTGFVTTQYLQFDAPSPAMSGTHSPSFGAEASPRGGVKAKLARATVPLKLRDIPSPSGKTLALVEKGAPLKIVRVFAGPKSDKASPGMVGGWSDVVYRNTRGWVPTEWLNA